MTSSTPLSSCSAAAAAAMLLLYTYWCTMCMHPGSLGILVRVYWREESVLLALLVYYAAAAAGAGGVTLAPRG